MAQRISFRVQSCVALAALALVGTACSGGKESAPTNPATVAPAPAKTTEAMAEQAALPLAVVAAVPKTLKCKDEIVWGNTTKKTYHEKGDPYYGRTKHGQYMCKAAAEAAGYHIAGARHKGMKGEKPAPSGT